MTITTTTPPTIELSAKRMPALGLGTWNLSGDRGQAAIEEALELGYRHIDTAQMYGNEDVVGDAIEASGIARDELFVTTKIANDKHAPRDLRHSAETSLDDLGLDHVDLLLIHWPVEEDRQAATLAELALVAENEGLASHVGVSNFTGDQLHMARDHAPVEVLQVECHPYLAQRHLRAVCTELDVAFTAYSPLAKGRILDDDVIGRIADRRHATPTQVVLRWLLDLGVAAIPKASSRPHLEDNLGALDVTLDADDRVDLGELDSGDRIVDPAHAPWR